MSGVFDAVVNAAEGKGMNTSGKKEPSIYNPNLTLTKCFEKEQEAKRTYQPILAIGLLIFLIIQLIHTNELYKDVISTMLASPIVDVNLYEKILEQMRFYTTAVLCEFIAMFYFIIRWGFNTTVSDLFSNLLKKE